MKINKSTLASVYVLIVGKRAQVWSGLLNAKIRAWAGYVKTVCSACYVLEENSDARIAE